VHNHPLQQRILALLEKNNIAYTGKDKLFFSRLEGNTAAIERLYTQLYNSHPNASFAFNKLLETLVMAYQQRASQLMESDEKKSLTNYWFLSNEITGMSLYTDRFCGNIKNLQNKLDYFKELGVNFLHLMPMFESPEGESDGGYAVSDFRKVDKRFGTLEDLRALQQSMSKQNMYLMLDIVLNHTSCKHEWAEKARQGNKEYQDYFYMYNDRNLPDQFDKSMPEIFPEAAPGNFTYVPECKKWVMTVFHHYQWDLNYSNPAVLVAMLDTIFFYANLGVDVLRIDAPAFIWKQLGTTCQNLPQAHTILQLLKLCVKVATPGMALLGEAIVAPKEIMKYFGTGAYTALECDVAYNATHMALQWDALATGETRIMLASQQEILQKPYGTTWITYTRCHDDIGLGYDDAMIQSAGFTPYEHRSFIKNYYSGNHHMSMATGALFSSNPKTGDARISGSLASLCGLEKALEQQNEEEIELSIRKILLMQAHSFFIGGIPMLFYGDEMGYTNDYSYLKDSGKSYDNRWMHRPIIDWDKNKKRHKPNSTEHRIFAATQKLIQLRKKLSIVADRKNIAWIAPHNIHVAGYVRSEGEQRLFCIFNFSRQPAPLTWYAFKEHGNTLPELYDHWSGNSFTVGSDREHLVLEPYSFHLLEAK
jgi:amylosucrase